MAIVRPFSCVRPREDMVSQVAALPYDVYSRQEAAAAAKDHPYSFLRVDRAEMHFADDMSMYDSRVYEKAREILESWITDGVLMTDEGDNYYLYQLTMNGRSQTGFVGCSSVDDYLEQVIRKHENTREDKEQDRIRHVDVTGAHTGPIFLAYREQETLSEIMGKVLLEEPLYDFVSEDGIGHKVWRIVDKSLVEAVECGFAQVPCTYIADGHHRAASAVKVGLKRRAENPGYTGEEPFNYFLSVLFPESQLMIMDYNRVVKDLNGLTEEDFFTKVQKCFTVECVSKVSDGEESDAEPGAYAYRPTEKGTFGMYLGGTWYKLTIRDEYKSGDPVAGLDVSLLQDHLLNPILGIQDPRTDSRIDFVGGIRGLGELEKRVDTGMAVAFSMYPTSIQELFEVADAGLLMPPKSTWFEPKLRSGIFIHMLEGDSEN